jgi:hypothetical protein
MNTLITLLITTSLLFACKDQTKPDKRVVYNDDFKWTITIPEGFDTISALKWNKMQNRGEKAIEKTYDVEVENHAQTLFVFLNNQFNYFESNYQPFDVSKDGNYIENFRGVNNMLYGTFEAQIPGAKLDSSSSTATISGLTFQTFNVKITMPNKVVMNWHMFSRIFGKREFTVNIMTVDPKKEKELLLAWMNSKFNR